MSNPVEQPVHLCAGQAPLFKAGDTGGIAGALPMGVAFAATLDVLDGVGQAAIEQALVEQKSSEMFYNAAV